MLSLRGESDSDGVRVRSTGPCVAGVIVSVDAREGAWTYGVTFARGVHVLVEAHEIEDGAQYLMPVKED